jgi:hypothetical protein
MDTQAKSLQAESRKDGKLMQLESLLDVIPDTADNQVFMQVIIS